jgi:hypothetical protein
MTSPKQTPLDDDVPHPAHGSPTDQYDEAKARARPTPFLELSTDEVIALYGADDYLPRAVLHSRAQGFFDPLWWSLGDAAEYIEINVDINDFESSPQFRGLDRLEEAVRSGQLQTFGSVDAAAVSAMTTACWTQYQMIAHDARRVDGGSMTYDIVVRSSRSYRSSALNDHSYPSGEMVPSANFAEGEPGYHRVVSNVFVKEIDARKLFTVQSGKLKQARVGRKQKRIGTALKTLTIKGKLVYPNRGKRSYAEIARRIIDIWEDEDRKIGVPVEYLQSTEEQAVKRFYNQVQTLSDK